VGYARTYRDLDVFREAFSLSLEIHKESLQFPKIEQYALADQLRRSSKSVCANIAEGFGKQNFSRLEFRRFLMMALGSSEETSVWIKYSESLGYIDKIKADDWDNRCNKVTRMIQSMVTKISTQIDNKKSTPDSSNDASFGDWGNRKFGDSGNV
jgi:four helix bundle protein